MRACAWRILAAFSCALARPGAPERAAAMAVVVGELSVTLIEVGSPLPVAQKPKAATLVRGATEAAQLGAVTVTTLPLRLADTSLEKYFRI